MNKKGFTLVEIISVVVIIGLLLGVMGILVSKYINDSRKKTYAKLALTYIETLKVEASEGNYQFTDKNTVYYIPINCIEIENVEKSPYGKIVDGYVGVTYDGKENEYYFYALDDKKYGFENVIEKDINEKSIKSNMESIRLDLLPNKTNIKGIDKKTCDRTIVDYEIPPTYEECFEVKENEIINYYSDKEKCTRKVIIPEKINNVTIEKIGDGAFGKKNLNSVKLSDKIKEIGDYAFAYNNLKEVEIPNGVEKIGEYAFRENNITSVSFGKNLKVIGQSAFFFNRIENLTIPGNVEVIEGQAFRNNHIKKLVIEDGVKEIQSLSFADNQIEELALSKTINKISFGAFNDNQLENNPFIYARLEDGTIDYTTIVSYAGKERKKVIIPEKVNNVALLKIGERSFFYLQIEDVVMPNTVTEISRLAFGGNKLTKVNLPKNLMILGAECFQANRNLIEINIPKEIKTIDSKFIYETKIEKIEIPNSVTTISDTAFFEDEEKSSLTEIIIDKSKNEFTGYPFGLISDFDRIKFLR